MKKILFLLLTFLFVGCYKDVDVSTLMVTPTVEVSYTTVTFTAKSNIASSNLNLRLHLASDSNMSKNVQTFELGDTKEGLCKEVISNLEDGKLYFFQIEGYSLSSKKRLEVGSFTTLTAVPPTVTSKQPSNIAATSASCGGEIPFDGGVPVSIRGVCWSTSHNPTTENAITTDGDGSGSFVSDITELNRRTTYYVRAYATNSKGTSYGDEYAFTTTADIPTVTTTSVSSISGSSATGGGSISDDGGSAITARGICWSTAPSPTVVDNHTTNGSGSGSFTGNMTGLTGGTTYYVRAYATNSAGTGYGDQVSFTTSANSPVVTTNPASNITSTSATCGGNVTSSGGSSVSGRGVCWSTSSNPSIYDNHTTNGSGTGSFTSNLTGLTPGTTYHVRAYATNSIGTSYGSQESFTTSVSTPTVTTSSVSNITGTTASCGGSVTATGGASVTARGVCWSTSQNPTTSNSHTTNGTGTGSFTSSITGLIAGTTYYVRAYATNSAGTSYGSQVSFTTSVTVPTVTTSYVSNITGTTASCGGSVTATGGASVTARGVCWSTSQNPTTSNSHTTNGTGTGSYNSNITGLSTGTTYYVRAYATNSVGTSYGAQVSFTTSATTPTVTTSSVSNITSTSASCGGNVTATGGASVTARGVCWSASQNPTISNNHTTNGTGTGSFTSSITGLSGGTTYYVRAYATNSAGTAYGSQVNFTTPTSAPTVTTSPVSSISSTSASCGGNVTSTGGANVTARGVCWSTSQNPTTNNSHTTDGTGSGSFSSTITGLSANTHYYVRAYATNSHGTSYGDSYSFYTTETITISPVTITGISYYGATVTATVTGGGIISRGFCWSTSIGYDYPPTIGGNGCDHCVLGSGEGTFSYQITNAIGAFNNSVRAYVITSGGTIIYGPNEFYYAW